MVFTPSCSENGNRLYLLRSEFSYDFQGNTEVHKRINLSFQFQMNKKERVICKLQSLLFVSLNFINFTYTLDAFVNKSSRSFGNAVKGLSKSVLEEKCSILSNTKKSSNNYEQQPEKSITKQLI